MFSVIITSVNSSIKWQINTRLTT